MTASSNNSIRAIDKESVHRICSGQVVLDMATAVKELLENSLDAGSTSIVIKFKQSGLDHITVTDNGCGITDANLETLALKHYTSKLRSFNDLALVRSFGFRGEALSSLCALANLTVTTSTGASPTGVLVEYTSDGVIKSRTPTPMTKGTIVKISNLFEGLPVRRSEFVKNIKREYSKCVGLIQAYALIVPNVRISCVSQMDKKPAITQIATSGNASIRQNIINVFGPKAMADIVEFDLLLVKGQSSKGDEIQNIDEGADDEDGDEQNQKGDIILKGYISSPAFGKGRSSADRQYLYINGRPCVLPKIARVINEVYHSFNTNQTPFLVANLILPTSYYDVNVSPDKRTIFLHNERMLVEELRNKLTELFEPSRSTFAVSEARQLIKTPDLATRLKSGSIEHKSSLSNEQRQNMDEADEDRNKERDTKVGRHLEVSAIEPITMSSFARSTAKATTGSVHVSVARLEQTTLTDRLRPIEQLKNLKRKAEDAISEPRDGTIQDGGRLFEQYGADTAVEEIAVAAQENGSHLVSPASTGHSDPILDVMEGYDPLDDRTREEDDPASDSEEEQEHAMQQRPSKLQRVVVLDSEVHHEGDREWVEVGFSMEEQQRRRAIRIKNIRETRRLEQERVALRKERAQQRLATRQQDTACAEGDESEVKESESVESDDNTERGPRRSLRRKNKMLSDASFANMDDVKAQKSLSRVISKGDFSRMKILGQFNKAFIVARLDNYAEADQSQDASDSCKSTKGQRRGALISSDIFVIDQHASDEKYNFETLQAKTVFSTQRLFQPKKLYLTAQEEITVVEHMKMLNKNGFYLDYDPDAPVSHRLKLVTLPVSERVVFDLQDFEELVFLLSQQTALPSSDHDNAPGQGSEESQDRHGHDHRHRHNDSQCSKGPGPEKMVRCSKVRALFASRACRRSVMIGHVLNHSQMKKIVRHMGEIDQPWNCPHGRPTMRHLLDLAELEQQERRARIGTGSCSPDDHNDEDYGDEGSDQEPKLLSIDRTGAFDSIALKRPTRHQGTLFRQFMAIPTPRTHIPV
ncbi:hypothetical protein BC939DRAFT_461161 [Gamsiella multidivaricata]|uniref:uncharacterized protein n=1 Tax=Gamsiella multidivaricata TaxID=101098 RepID=UPI00221F8DF4|nr:uncharacterized protein BC939DRAFT_461161 [Gamsiella multidivaricata]KAG0364939.1 Mismatch repair endonuclease pms2 [Gamsiella multidivaricata]KAI7819109.1 hypothetical protein BC939DRAFT_461161 [Gamsiella multidivaricata]